MGAECDFGDNCTEVSLGGWVWSSGSPWDVNFHHFATGHPTGPGGILLDAGQPIWNSDDWGNTHGFVCEIKLF